MRKRAWCPEQVPRGTLDGSAPPVVSPAWSLSLDSFLGLGLSSPEWASLGVPERGDKWAWMPGLHSPLN